MRTTRSELGALGFLWRVTAAVGLVVGATGCCNMGKNKTSWETTDTVGEAYVEVNRYLPNGERDVANVRDRPGQTGTRVIAQLTHGTRVKVLENTKLADGYWSRVHFDVMEGGEGWMHQDVLNKSATKGQSQSGNGNGGKYGAISFNSATNNTSVSYNNGSPSEASNRANANSGGGSVVVSVFNECGAYARATNGANGWGKAQTRGEAETTALRECNARGAGCSVRGWVCAKLKGVRVIP